MRISDWSSDVCFRSWRAARPLLEPIGAVFDDGPQPLGALLAALREASIALCGDALWAGPAGRALAEWFAELEARAALGPREIAPESLAPPVRQIGRAACRERGLQYV